MADDLFDAGELNDPRITRRRSRRTSEAVSSLCSSWFRAGGDILVGALNTGKHVAEDLTGTYCDRDRNRTDD